MLVIHGVQWRWACACSSADPSIVAPSPFGPFLYAGVRARRVTTRLVDYLVDQWTHGKSATVLAAETGLTDRHIRSLVLEELRSPQRRRQSRYAVSKMRPQFLAMDEVFWQKQAITLVIDNRPPEDGIPGLHRRVIEVLPSREPDVLETFFRQLITLHRELGVPDWSPVIATDMWGSFRIAIQRAFAGRAIHVADRFHLTLKIRQDLKKAVTQVIAEEQGIPIPYSETALRNVASQPAARTRLATLDACYTKALKAQTKKVEGSGVDTSLLNLALSLHALWHHQPSQHAAVTHYRKWRAYVAAWPERFGINELKPSRVRPFSTLTHLFDREGWLLEVTNAFADPVMRTTDEGITWLNGAVSTGRLERINRTAGLLKRLHQRSPRAGGNWMYWQEREFFEAFRERLLYGLNVPPSAVKILHSTRSWTLPTCACGHGLSLPDITARHPRSAWDVPLAGARHHVTWEDWTLHCPACQEVTNLALNAGDGITEDLAGHLHETLRGDYNLTRLQKQTGVSRRVLQTLEAQVPAPEPVPWPEHLAALPFTWRGKRRLALLDVERGTAVTLLAGADLGAHVTPGDLRRALQEPQASHVRKVWVDDPFWIDHGRTQVTYVLDPFSTSRLLTRALQRLQTAFTRTLSRGVTLTQLMRQYRTTIVRHPDHTHWPTLARQQKARDRILDQRTALKTLYPMLDLGLRAADDLRALIERPEPPGGQDLDQWLGEVNARFEEARRTPKAGREGDADLARKALQPFLDQLQPAHPVRLAVLEGARLSPAPQPKQVINGRVVRKERGQALNLTACRREVQALRTLDAFNARGELSQDWARLLRAVQSRGQS